MKEPIATEIVTLALPRDVLRRVKVIAKLRGISVSRLLIEALRQVAERNDAFERARDRARNALRRPPDLGTGGRRSWTRDELHER